MSNTPVNLQKFNQIFDQQVLQGISYRLGGKAPSLSATPAELEKGIDCSGFARLDIAQASNGAVVWPDGSWMQRAYCEEHYEEVPYSVAMNAKAGELYVSFITAGVNGAGKIGHVWFTAERDRSPIAETMESYGGHGIGSRPANQGVLVRLHHKSFSIPTTSTVVVPKPVAAEKLLIDWNGQKYTMEQIVEKLAKHEVLKITERLDESRIYIQSKPVVG